MKVPSPIIAVPPTSFIPAACDVVERMITEANASRALSDRIAADIKRLEAGRQGNG
ncbi:MAG: hypothetical protein JNK56_39480 [Myxococcales bacterium]|nr:hypothetical protein [Myxococcales bacterium]